jgi:hypothetical protein
MTKIKNEHFTKIHESYLEFTPAPDQTLNRCPALKNTEQDIASVFRNSITLFFSVSPFPLATSARSSHTLLFRNLPFSLSPSQQRQEQHLHVRTFTIPLAQKPNNPIQHGLRPTDRSQRQNFHWTTRHHRTTSLRLPPLQHTSPAENPPSRRGSTSPFLGRRMGPPRRVMGAVFPPP